MSKNHHEFGRRRSRLRSRSRLGLGALATCAVASAALAEPDAIVGISFEFKDLTARGRVTHIASDDASLKSFEADIARKLAEVAGTVKIAEDADESGRRFRWWRFEVRPPEDADCRFSIQKRSGAWLLVIEVPANDEFKSDAALREAGATFDNPLPKNGEWLEAIPQCFEKVFLDEHAADLEHQLRQLVPLTLAKPGWVDVGAETRSLLPLPWSQYQDLAVSRFLVKLNWHGEGRVNIEGYGACLGAPLPGQTENGLVLNPSNWKKGEDDQPLEDLITLRQKDEQEGTIKGVGVFLDQWIDPGDDPCGAPELLPTPDDEGGAS